MPDCKIAACQTFKPSSMMVWSNLQQLKRLKQPKREAQNKQKNVQMKRIQNWLLVLYDSQVKNTLKYYSMLNGMIIKVVAHQ